MTQQFLAYELRLLSLKQNWRRPRQRRNSVMVPQDGDNTLGTIENLVNGDRARACVDPIIRVPRRGALGY